MARVYSRRGGGGGAVYFTFGFFGVVLEGGAGGRGVARGRAMACTVPVGVAVQSAVGTNVGTYM